MNGWNSKNMTKKTLSCLMIALMLAGCALPARQTTDSPLVSSWSSPPVPVTSQPASSGGAGRLLAPTADRFVASAGSTRLAPAAIVRITP